MNDVKKLKAFLFNVLVCSLLVSFGQLRAQVAVNKPIAEDQVQFANNTNFEIGTLTIKVKLPPAKTNAEVTVTLPTGIEYVVGSETLGANATSVTYQTSSPLGKPVFTMVGTPNKEVTFTIKRKITKAATTARRGVGLVDKVKAVVIGEGEDEKDTKPYKVTPPEVTIQDVSTVSDVPMGENTTTFGIRNTGAGATRTIFFSVAYPAGVTHISFTPPLGVDLDQVGTVPTGFENAGQLLYRLTKPTGFLPNELVTITQKYQVAPSLCGGKLKIGYVPYWGASGTDLFEQNTRADREVGIRTYAPLVKKNTDAQKTYFEYGEGLCAPSGQKLGTFYTAFKNESTDRSTAYNNRLTNLSQYLNYFEVKNFYIIASDGTKIPITETSNNGVATTVFDFRTHTALLATNPALAGKNIGFTDEDNDGYLDDLKYGAEVRICYDLVSKGLPFVCGRLFPIHPSYYWDYDNICGSAMETLRVNQDTYIRALSFVNQSRFPAQLLLNAPEKGYLSPGMTNTAVYERLQGVSALTPNNFRYRYQMQLPPGIGLKNVVFHYTKNDDFTDTTAPTITIGNIPAGGSLDFTTPDTPPPGVGNNEERYWGHISFEMELSNCTGMSDSASIPYTISIMTRNKDGITFCPMPLVCENVTVFTGCSTPCTVNGPEIRSTRVERADNSYGWTDATMTTHVQRANVSAEQRRKILQYDDVEIFAEGRQSVNSDTDNLYYYMSTLSSATLVPKSIKVTIGAQHTTLQATMPGVVEHIRNNSGNYYRWNLTSVLPAGNLAAGQTFSVMATYQMNNPIQNSAEKQSGVTSYFYTLADKTDMDIDPKGFHTNMLRCGSALIPVFTMGDTEAHYGSNAFSLSACNPSAIGGNLIFSGRTQGSGSTYYTEEYRPGRLIKKITIKMPLGYKISDPNLLYFYTPTVADDKKNASHLLPKVTIPLSQWVETTEGGKRVYTYTNPPRGTQYYLPPGMIKPGTYSEYLRATIQASCKGKDYTRDITPGRIATAAEVAAAGEQVIYSVDYEDYYYHYADLSNSLPTNQLRAGELYYKNKPQLLLTAQGQGSTMRANREEQSSVFAIETRYGDAPNAWISIPDVTGVEILGLEEVNDAAGTTVQQTFSPEANITGEKMFFLNQKLLVGPTKQKYFRLKFKLTNCSSPQIKFKVYAGWNCEGNPTQGYRDTCADSFLEYIINIAQSKKDIEKGANPANITMCAKTPFSYIVKSTNEGDIFGANLVVTQQPGIVISDVQVEYPLNSGKVYNTTTPVDGKKIGVTTVGGKTTYQLFDILPGGSLPGSVATNVENEQKFKVTFNVQPDCGFVAGSSFDIDLEGNNLCGVPAVGPKVIENVAGITGATVNDYNMLLSSVDYVNGNANACDSGATYKVRVSVNVTSSNPLFTVGNDARLHIRFPQSYDIQSSDITIDRSAFPQANPSSSWADPSVESTGVVGGENEIIMKVPAGMKDTHYFYVTVKIKQKANTAVSCTDERSLKVLTTDKITGIPCATLSPPFCPALIVSTSPEKKAKIENKRASLSLADVKVSSTVQGNKEKLMIKYKVTNAATAKALYNGSLKVSLYHDTNGNGLVDAGDTLLKDNPQIENIAIGATSPERSFTYVADQSEVCRLLLAIKDNYCLCDNVVSLATPPAEITGLISDATICESDSKVLNYVAAPAPVYQAYTWEAVSPANALDYLSATNIALPTFHYTGTKLTTTTEFKYKLKVKRTNGCEATQEVKLTVKPAPSITTQPVAPANPYCTGTNATALTVVADDYGLAGTLSYEWYESITNAYNGTLKGSSPTYTPPTNAAGIKYYYVKVKNTGCGETLSNIIMVKTNATPTQPTVAQDQAAGCGTVSTAKVSNHSSYASGITFKVTKGGTPVSATVASNGSINGISEAGTYVIKALEDGCESAGTTFTIDAKKPVPGKPTLTLTAEDCTKATIAKITNHAAGKTYTFIKSSDNSTVTGTSVDGTGKITNLAVGKYKVKATKDGCTSDLSDEFEIKDKKLTPAKPTVAEDTAATCSAISTAKVSNYNANFTYTIVESANTNNTVSAASVVAGGKITGLPVGKYKVKATKNGCISDLSDEFEIKDIKPTPVVPTVSEHTAATCSAISIAKLNYTVGLTYIFVKSDDNTEVSGTSVDNTGKISGLSVGKYKVKAKKDGCESALSAEFEIKDKLPTPAAPTIGEKTAATCTAISVAKVDNYSSYSATDVYTILDSSNTVVATASVASDGTINGLTTAGTYKIKVTNTQGCTSAEATITIAGVLPVPATPTPTATQSFCNSATIADLAPQGTDIKWYDAATGGSLLTSTTALVHNNKYYVARTLGSCESPRAEVTVKIISLAQPTLVATAVAPTCTAEGKAKITNYDPSATYTFTKADGTAVTETITIAPDGIVTGLVAGSYKVKASKDSCEATSADFQIADKLPAPAAPTIGEKTAATCTAISVAKVTDYDNGLTYTIKDSANATVGNVESDGTISGLTVAGTYKITATNTQGCTSVEATITINPVQAAPAKPDITLTPASCTSPTVAKIRNQVSGLTFWHNGTQLTVNPITHEIMGLAPGTYTITAKNNNNCESVASDSFEIKAQQTATTITTAPAGATYQKGTEATPLAVVATGEGTLSYKWYKNRDNNNTSGTEVGDNSPSYKPATDTVGSLYYWVEVTSDCGAVKSDVAEIKVVEGAPTIEANDDPDTTVRRGQEVAVLGNDKVNGNPATPADVDITISNDGGLTRVGVNPATGKIMIPNDAVPATYEITYKICVKNQPTICDEAKVKITVEVPVHALKAVDDDFGKIPNAVDYTTTNTVFSTGVDTMEGVVGNLSPERDVVLTPGAQPHENITMNPNGSITVKRGTPKGTYTYEYTICQKDVPTNCDKAKVSFEVIEAHIFAKDDGVWEVGTEGALTPSILNNDILGERVGIAPSEVDIQQTQGEAVIDKTKMEMNTDGRISVRKGIPEGTYTYYYTITEKANTANFSKAKVIIRVVNFSAQDDEFNITNDKTKEFKTESVLANDELNKKKNPSPVDDVILTIGEAKDAERNPTNALTMNEDGTITIAPNTPDGVYTYTYRICKRSASTECKSAEAVIKLLPALIANDDDFTANPINPLVKEGIAGNVLDNDRYADGNALEHLDKVKITMLDNDKSGARIEQNGNVVIPQGAPAGDYTLAYSLCMKDHPTICADAKVKIVILEDKPLVIHNGISANGDGVNDGFMIEHIEGYPKNNLKIFNRWGVLVYEKDGYTNSEPFDGHSNGRATISAESKLPQGTYYYILEYQDTAEQTHTKKGWLYLKY